MNMYFVNAYGFNGKHCLSRTNIVRVGWSKSGIAYLYKNYENNDDLEIINYPTIVVEIETNTSYFTSTSKKLIQMYNSENQVLHEWIIDGEPGFQNQICCFNSGSKYFQIKGNYIIRDYKETNSGSGTSAIVEKPSENLFEINESIQLTEGKEKRNSSYEEKGKQPPPPPPSPKSKKEEIKFKYKNYDEWQKEITKNDLLASHRGFAYPIVRKAFEAGREMKDEN